MKYFLYLSSVYASSCFLNIYIRLNSHETFSEFWCALDRLSHLLPENLISNNFKITFFFFFSSPKRKRSSNIHISYPPIIHDMILHTCISLMYMDRPVLRLCIDYTNSTIIICKCQVMFFEAIYLRSCSAAILIYIRST